MTALEYKVENRLDAIDNKLEKLQSGVDFAKVKIFDNEQEIHYQMNEVVTSIPEKRSHTSNDGRLLNILPSKRSRNFRTEAMFEQSLVVREKQETTKKTVFVSVTK